MNLNVRKKEIEDRLTEIRMMADKENDATKLEEMEKEVDGLQEERKVIERKMNLESKTKFMPFNNVEMKSNDEELEKRGSMMREGRTVTIATSDVLLPQHISPTIAKVPYQEVSTLVDRVKIVNLVGGETYKKSFVKSNGTGGTTAEGTAYTDAEPTFGYATVTKVKITAYAEVTEELEKLPSLPYQAEVINSVNTALRKKISEQILRGAGDSNTFTGIFSTKATAIEQKDLEITAIDENTLDDIIFAYGGNEEVENGAVLILNKNDLRAFAKLRTKEGRKVHTIDYNNNTIDGIPYIINSNCKSITDPATTAGEYGMAYGSLLNYELPIFSPVEVAKSTDYKFKDGIICYKASVFAGGNVTGFNGFIRIKKGTVAA